MTKNIRQALKNRLDIKQDRLQAKHGMMGDGTGVLEVANIDNYVYVRTSAGIEEVFNNRVPPENDLMVMLGYDPAQPDLYQLLSTRTAAPGGVTGGAVAGYAPAIRYQWMADGGGQDPLWVDLRQTLPLRVGVYLGMLVQIYHGSLKSGTSWIDVATQTKNLTAHIPITVGNAAFVLITVDTSGAVAATKGTETTIALLSLADIPTAPTGTLVELAAVRVYYGQIAIQEARSNTDIKDLRLPYFMTGALTASAPADAQYVTLAANGTLTNERILTGSSLISVTDGGAGSTVTLAVATDGNANHYLRGDGTWVAAAAISQLHEHVYQEDHSRECIGSKTEFVTAQEYQSQAISVYLNGLLQRPTVAFSEGAFCDVITLTTAPVAGDELIMEYITA